VWVDKHAANVVSPSTTLLLSRNKKCIPTLPSAIRSEKLVTNKSTEQKLEVMSGLEKGE